MILADIFNVTTQLDMSCRPDSSLPPTFLRQCLLEIKILFTSNSLKPKRVESELLLVGMKSTLSKANSLSLAVDSCAVFPCRQVKSLGVILDSSLSFHSHVNNMTQSALFHLCKINPLCPSLAPHTMAILIYGLVIPP